MKRFYNWYDRYHIALKENLSVKDIMKLRNVGQPTAMKIRKEAWEYCLKNDIPTYNGKVPSEVVQLVTEKDLNYYHEKMILEHEAVALHESIMQ
ncbi:hypothetical protein MKD05_17745 [[Clostridium] innocuum]|nr:hypothetical protein [[Clostridium] innocuum]